MRTKINAINANLNAARRIINESRMELLCLLTSGCDLDTTEMLISCNRFFKEIDKIVEIQIVEDNLNLKDSIKDLFV